MSSMEGTIRGSYFSYKHLTSIGKKRRQLTHAQTHTHTHTFTKRTKHLREMTRRGQHSTPKTQQVRGQEKRKEGGKRDDDT